MKEPGGNVRSLRPAWPPHFVSRFQAWASPRSMPPHLANEVQVVVTVSLCHPVCGGRPPSSR
uniref:Uncharacterized protein n=1 Tax=Macaca fascicularis TaxID=9541 RepID=A0A7N9IF35_MACFA